jgi:hypothetical protein
MLLFHFGDCAAPRTAIKALKDVYSFVESGDYFRNSFSNPNKSKTETGD